MNWGNKLLLAFIVFAAGMFYLVYRSVNTNYELVEKDYYNKELRYQQVIDGMNRVNQLSNPVKLEQTGRGIILQLPEEMKNKAISGDVWFYCAYDEKKDKKFRLQPDADGMQIFQLSSVLPGNYMVKITWQGDGKDYFTEKKLTIL
ncbi:MAG: FixH family protein [Sphingobacteriales bacterium]|nr:FixH family protein [Sphingobacteriales bacterium]